jgi:predicted phospho-2-dehydro-3-deoxyheptonate aldolase
MSGKQIRLERIINRVSGRSILVPMDHGVSLGPVAGLIDVRATVDAVANGGANGVIMHKGLVSGGHRKSGRDVGLIIHMSASTDLAVLPNTKTLVCTVEEAIKLGADAVSIHVNIGDEREDVMLRDMGAVSRATVEWGIPLVAMVYARGPKVPDGYAVEVVRHAARVGAELGADLVKVPYTGSPETFREVVEGCHVPVLIAGGPKMDSDRDILAMTAGAVAAGGAGVSIGRNVFQAEDPEAIVRALTAIVHEDRPLAQAVELL